MDPAGACCVPTTREGQHGCRSNAAEAVGRNGSAGDGGHANENMGAALFPETSWLSTELKGVAGDIDGMYEEMFTGFAMTCWLSLLNLVVLPSNSS